MGRAMGALVMIPKGLDFLITGSCRTIPRDRRLFDVCTRMVIGLLRRWKGDHEAG